MKKGFTLVETIVTIFVFAVAMATILAIIAFLYKSHGHAWRQSEAVYEARKGIETMVQEIREAHTAEDGSYVIDKAEDYEFSFYSDVNKDSLVEKVRYFVDGNEFKKGVIEPEGIPAVYPQDKEKIYVLSKYVINNPPIFRYFDGSGNELPAPARRKDTKLMRVSLIININPNRPSENSHLESEAQIRNLKTNF